MNVSVHTKGLRNLHTEPIFNQSVCTLRLGMDLALWEEEEEEVVVVRRYARVFSRRAVLLFSSSGI